MQNKIIEITYMYWEKFFVMEDNKCQMLAYPMHPSINQQRQAANV